MHQLTPQRLCEHSLASKLTVCPLKDYSFDRIRQIRSVRCSTCMKSMNGALRKCRWGKAKRTPSAARQAVYHIPSHLSYSTNQLRGVCSEVRLWVRAASISALRNAINYPKAKKNMAMTSRLWNLGRWCISNVLHPRAWIMNHWIWW